MNTLNEKITENFARSYENLQDRFAGKIEVVTPKIIIPVNDPREHIGEEVGLGFRRISAPVENLKPLFGRVLLYYPSTGDAYFPAVLTEKNNTKQLSIAPQPFDPNVGITSGIRFALGLKQETAQDTFGAHTKSGGFEAGHFAPVMLGANSLDVRKTIVEDGDQGTHSVGNDVGGIPEKMIQNGLLNGISVRTSTIKDGTVILPLAWHPKLESDEGMMSATYDGPTNAVKLMLGAASSALGARALDSIGSLVDDSIRGRH